MPAQNSECKHVRSQGMQFLCEFLSLNKPIACAWWLAPFTQESCTVEGQYCPPQKVRNPDGTQPNGNCCVSKVWVPGTCGSAGIDVNATETAQLASGSDMYVLPFPLDFKTTSASCMSAPGMSYPQVLEAS